MAREDRWRDSRNWDFDRDGREFDSRPGYGQGEDRYRDYRRGPYAERMAREDRYRREPQSDYDEHAYQPFGTVGPTAYYSDPGYGYGGPGAYAPRRGDYQAPRDDAPRPRERDEEPRSFIDKATDEVASWFGDSEASRRLHSDQLRGAHRGRGPKDYRRSDERIREDLNDRLTEDPYIDATEIMVAVTDREVTLTGYVLHREDKRRAERLAEQVTGVGEVQNNIRVKRDDGPAASAGVPSAGNF